MLSATHTAAIPSPGSRTGWGARATPPAPVRAEQLKVTKWTQHCQQAVTSDRGLTRFRHPLTKARTDFYKKPIKGLSQCRRGREGWSYRQGTAELSFR